MVERAGNFVIPNGREAPVMNLLFVCENVALTVMQKLLIVALCFLTVLLTACSPRDYLTRRLATDLIATSESFNTSQQFILHTGVMSNKDYAAPEYVILLHKGWISATTIACPKQIVPPPCWDVLLTASGVDTVHAIAPAPEDDKTTFTIPVAKRELIAVTGISKQGGSAVVEFTWKWAPVNEVGAALYSTDQRFRSDVGFRQYDDGWRIVPGTPRPVQPMDDALKNAEPLS